MTFLISKRAQGICNSPWSLWCRGESLLCLSDPVRESSVSPAGTCSSLSAKQGGQHSAHQMVICPTSHCCRNPESLQPKAASSIHAARHFLPTTLPNGSSQNYGLPRQTGSSICSSFWQRDISLSGSTSWLHWYRLARRMIWPLSIARPGLLEPFRACAWVPSPPLEHSI